MVTLVEDIEEAIEEASETRKEVNELINGRFYEGPYGMNIRVASIDLDTRELEYKIYWLDGETKDTKKSLDSDYWERSNFLRNFSDEPTFTKRTVAHIPKNPNWAVDIGD